MNAATLTDHGLHQRAEFIKGLRALADILEATPDLPLPYTGATGPFMWIATSGQDHKAIAQTFARAIPGTIAKTPRDADLDLIGSVHGLNVQLIVDRDAVCQRVVTGTETVTLPARPATEATPERTVEREVVEWVCEPLMAEVHA